MITDNELRPLITDFVRGWWSTVRGCDIMLISVILLPICNTSAKCVTLLPMALKPYAIRVVYMETLLPYKFRNYIYKHTLYIHACFIGDRYGKSISVYTDRRPR